LAGGGASIVVATHDRDLISAVADRELRVADGGVREVEMLRQ